MAVSSQLVQCSIKQWMQCKLCIEAHLLGLGCLPHIGLRPLSPSIIKQRLLCGSHWASTMVGIRHLPR